MIGGALINQGWQGGFSTARARLRTCATGPVLQENQATRAATAWERHRFGLLGYAWSSATGRPRRIVAVNLMIAVVLANRLQPHLLRAHWFSDVVAASPRRRLAVSVPRLPRTRRLRFGTGPNK